MHAAGHEKPRRSPRSPRRSLSTTTSAQSLERISAEAARALQVERARIDVGDRPLPDPPSGEAHELRVGGRRVGTIVLEGWQRGESGARRRLLPALASLLGVAIDRERLAREALDAEALRRGDVIKTALLRAVSHDLRTPLMAISTSAGALARPDLAIDAADRAELLATILDASDRLDRLVDNLLDLSRLQAGAAQPEQQLWEIDELRRAGSTSSAKRQPRVEVTFSDESSQRVDAHQIERVLANLVENAIKYSPAGEPVRGEGSDALGGGDPCHRPRGKGNRSRSASGIFEPFHRGKCSGDADGAGPRARRIARAARVRRGERSRVWAESRSGQAATFVPSLPLAVVEARRVMSAWIFVVDDEQQIPAGALRRD